MEETHGTHWIRGSIIGKGSFGSVFLGYCDEAYSFLPPLIAVKSAELSDSCSLQKEFEVLNNLRGSPYIIRSFSDETTTGINGGMVYNILLEYASSGSLETLIGKSMTGLPESTVSRYAKHLLLGLAHIHESGYIHCDLKPDNVLIVPNSSKFGSVAKIGDLGLAKRAKQSKKSKYDRYLRGTAAYMAPEVVIDHIQEAPADIWAYGCVVLEMLTGKSPWDPDSKLTEEEIYEKISNNGALPQVNAKNLSDEAKDFLKKCLVRNPMFRFTADMLLDHPFLSIAGKNDVDEVIASSSSPWLTEDDLNGICDEEVVSALMGNKRKRDSHFLPITDGHLVFNKFLPTIPAGIAGI